MGECLGVVQYSRRLSGEALIPGLHGREEIMSKADHQVSIAELLRGGPIEWPKPEKDFDVMKHIASHHAHIIYEDDHVVSFEIDEDERETKMEPGERRITVAPKHRVESLLDLGTAVRLMTWSRRP